jgi:hypothetical protein
MRLNDTQQQDFDLFPGAHGLLEAQAECGPAYTIMVDGLVLMCFGAVEIFPGVAEAWLLPDNRITAYKVLMGRNSRMFFDQLGTAMKLRRCQMSVDVSFTSAIRYSEWCKFEIEGVMRKFGINGNDHVMMARVYR